MVFAIAVPNTIECNNNASQNGVSTVYIIHGQFVGVNKPSRLKCLLHRGFSTSVLFIVYNKLNTYIEMYCMCKEAGIVENHSLRAIKMTCVTSTKRISLHDDDVIVT